MATIITSECINCGACEPECPNTAIYQGGVEWELNGKTHPALADDIFYIVAEKCTECVGFHDKEACAAVCPVDCCIPDPERPETEDVLIARAKTLHPDVSFTAPFPSRFREEGAGAAAPGGPAQAPTATEAPAAEAERTQKPAPAPAASAAVAAAEPAPAAKAAETGKAGKAAAASGQTAERPETAVPAPAPAASAAVAAAEPAPAANAAVPGPGGKAAAASGQAVQRPATAVPPREAAAVDGQSVAPPSAVPPAAAGETPTDISLSIPALEQWEIPIRCFRCERDFAVPFRYLRAGTVFNCTNCHGAFVPLMPLCQAVERALRGFHDAYTSRAQQFQEHRRRELEQFQEEQRRHLEAFEQRLREISREVKPPGAPVRKKRSFFGLIWPA